FITSLPSVGATDPLAVAAVARRHARLLNLLPAYAAHAPGPLYPTGVVKAQMPPAMMRTSTVRKMNPLYTTAVVRIYITLPNQISSAALPWPAAMKPHALP